MQQGFSAPIRMPHSVCVCGAHLLTISVQLLVLFFFRWLLLWQYFFCMTTQEMMEWTEHKCETLPLCSLILAWSYPVGHWGGWYENNEVSYMVERHKSKEGSHLMILSDFVGFFLGPILLKTALLHMILIITMHKRRWFLLSDIFFCFGCRNTLVLYKRMTHINVNLRHVIGDVSVLTLWNRKLRQAIFVCMCVSMFCYPSPLKYTTILSHYCWMICYLK